MSAAPRGGRTSHRSVTSPTGRRQAGKVVDAAHCAAAAHRAVKATASKAHAGHRPNKRKAPLNEPASTASGRQLARPSATSTAGVSDAAVRAACRLEGVDLPLSPTKADQTLVELGALMDATHPTQYYPRAAAAAAAAATTPRTKPVAQSSAKKPRVPSRTATGRKDAGTRSTTGEGTLPPVDHHCAHCNNSPTDATLPSGNLCSPPHTVAPTTHPHMAHQRRRPPKLLTL